MSGYGAITKYSVEEHRSRVLAFLVWPDLILATSFSSCGDAYHTYVRSVEADPGKPIGAGKCGGVMPEMLETSSSFPNFVVRWYSDTLELVVPEDSMSVVLEALNVRREGDYRMIMQRNMVKAERFNDSPESLREAMRHIAMLLEGNPTFEIPFTDGNYGGTLHDALNIVEHACPNLNWVRQARVRWLEYGLAAWEKMLLVGMEDEMYKTPHMRSTPLPLGFTEDTLRYFMTVERIGEDCWRLTDRYLDLMQVARRQPQRTEWSYRWYTLRMILLIQQRTGCFHRNDSRRDRTAFNLLAEKYQLGITAVELEGWDADKFLRGE